MQVEQEIFFTFAELKKFTVISFLFIFLCTNTTFGELLRLPILIHHYKEHIIWDNNASFLDFLTKHYASKIDHPDDKHNDHEKLPFKSVDFSASQVVSIVPQTFIPLPGIVFTDGESRKINHSHQHISSAFLGSIWQPPRFS